MITLELFISLKIKAIFFKDVVKLFKNAQIIFDFN